MAERLLADVVFVGATAGAVTGVEPSRRVHIDHSVEDAPTADVLVNPGGIGWERIGWSAASTAGSSVQQV